MHLVGCENPQRIYNQYVREWQTVPCGKCHTCRQRKSSLWVSRLEQERKCWRYSLFFTLTYDEEHVPYMELDMCNGTPYLRGVRTDYCMSPEELEQLDDESKEYIFKVKKLRVLSSKDAQNFIKRLRYHVSEYLGKSLNWSDSHFRYYLIGEYGETTLRPHYHGIIFTDSKAIVDIFDKLLFESWSVYDRVAAVYRPYGRTDWSVVVSSASSYVAQYLNCTYNLPEVLAATKVRPFSLQSRRPPIGSLLQSDAQILEIFHRGLTSYSVRDEKRQMVVPVVLPQYLQNRLFPKCPRFSSVSTDVRITAYRIGTRFQSDLEHFIYYDGKTFLEQCEIFMKRCSESAEWNLYNYLDEVTTHFVDVNAMARLLRMSLRVLNQCAILKCSLDYYVSRIELYYSNVSARNLRLWYQFQDDYLKDNRNPVTDVLSADLDFVESVVNGTAKNFDYDSFSDLSELDYRNASDYLAMVRHSEIIYIKTSKTKKKNDYLEAHPEKALFVYG